MKLLQMSAVLLLLAFMSFALVVPVIAQENQPYQPPPSQPLSNQPPSGQPLENQSTSNQPPSSQPPENQSMPNQQPTYPPTENNIPPPPQTSTYSSYAENFFGNTYDQYSPYIQQYMPPTTAGFGGYCSFLENYQPYIQQLGPVIENFGSFYENTFNSTPFQTVMNQYSTNYAFGMIENCPGLMDVYAHLSENDPQHNMYQNLVGENFKPPEWVMSGGTGWQVQDYTWVPSENWQVPQGWAPSSTWTTPENWTPPQDMYNYVVSPWMPQSAWTKPENWCPAADWVSPENWVQPNFSGVATQVQGMFENAMTTIMPSMSGFDMMPEKYHWVPPENCPFFTWNIENISPGSPVHIFMDENFQPWSWAENQTAQQMGQTIGQFKNAIVGGIKINPKAPIDNLVASVAFLDNIPENVIPPAAHVCGYLQIGTNADENIENAEIGFEVNKDWIDANNIDKNTLMLQHYVDGTWENLPSTIVGEDENYVYMEAETPSFSTFAVTGSTTGIMPTVPSAPIPPMYIVVVMAIILLVAVLAVVWRHVSLGTKALPRR